MKTVYFSTLAENIIGDFFESYKGYKNNDLYYRALIYRRIREFLTNFDISETYIVNGNKYIDIEKICTVEYVMRNKATEILVTNIILNDNIL